MFQFQLPPLDVPPGGGYHHQMSLAGVGTRYHKQGRYHHQISLEGGGYRTYPMMHVIYISPHGNNDGDIPVKTLLSRNFSGGQ